MRETPLHFRTITEIAEGIAAEQLSPVDVTAAMLARIETLDSRLKSYATVTADAALAAAQQAEREIKAGKYRGATARHPDCGEGPLLHEGCPHDGRGESACRSRACL